MPKYNFTLIIPSLNPDEKLPATVKSAVAEGIDDIILVDDGSKPELRRIFAELETLPEVTLLTHEKNRGKGAALKTAFAYFMENRPDRDGVVTADGDGQHKIEDIVACGLDMMKNSCRISLGCRDFSLENVPPKSRFGNKMTSGIFRLLCGMKLSDTQTGLRAVPRKYLPAIMEAEGTRYEYETNMLLLMNRRHIPYSEVPISTVYIDDNSASHFRPIRDSLRVYGLILKYIASSAVSTLVDIVTFYLIGLLTFTGTVVIDTFIYTVCARVVSSTVNFAVNRHIVFSSHEKMGRTLRRYICLAASVMLASWLLLSCILSLPIFDGIISFYRTCIKLVVDTVLFFFSFRIQQKWVFADKAGEDSKS